MLLHGDAPFTHQINHSSSFPIDRFSCFAHVSFAHHRVCGRFALHLDPDHPSTTSMESTVAVPQRQRRDRGEPKEQKRRRGCDECRIQHVKCDRNNTNETCAKCLDDIIPCESKLPWNRPVHSSVKSLGIRLRALEELVQCLFPGQDITSTDTLRQLADRCSIFMPDAADESAEDPIEDATRAQPLLNSFGVRSGSPSNNSPSTRTLVRILGITAPAASPNEGATSLALFPCELNLDGNLGDVAKDWTQEEQGMKRKRVQFQRSHSGSRFTATFNTITPEEWSLGSICISCIFWEAKNEYVVTSVDVIHLLESLVEVRFTRQEKDRIRRNLETFPSLVVSKGTAEEFLMEIQGFSRPKPWSIERNIKVFPWVVLSDMLKKIISRYVSNPPPSLAIPEY